MSRADLQAEMAARATREASDAVPEGDEASVARSRVGTEKNIRERIFRFTKCGCSDKRLNLRTAFWTQAIFCLPKPAFCG